jgi:Peroxidase
LVDTTKVVLIYLVFQYNTTDMIGSSILVIAAVALLLTEQQQLQACPYINANQQQIHVVPTGDYHATVTSPARRASNDASLNARREFQDKRLTRATTTTRRKLLFTTIFDFIAGIFDFILGFFRLGKVDSVEEAITRARRDIEDILDGNRAADMLRLAFHDCTDQKCDGCLDLNNLDNTGLAPIIAELRPIVERYAEFLTRGDVWVLASYVAIERQQVSNNVVSFDLQFVGRPSCADPANPPVDKLPSAHLNTADLVSFFSTTFQFDARETTAIMGAHTLYVHHQQLPNET